MTHRPQFEKHVAQTNIKETMRWQESLLTPAQKIVLSVLILMGAGSGWIFMIIQK